MFHRPAPCPLLRASPFSPVFHHSILPLFSRHFWTPACAGVKEKALFSEISGNWLDTEPQSLVEKNALYGNCIFKNSP